MDLINMTITEFAEVLGSRTPTPGGGGTCALVAALGIALGGMVAALTIGKEKYAAVDAEMRVFADRAASLKEELLLLIDKDAEAFGPLSKAYGLPRDTEEEKMERDEVMEGALREAAGPPMEIMEKCGEAVALLEILADKGSKMVISDAGTGAALCKAALKGAQLNVLVNTNMMKDREWAGVTEELAAKIVEEYSIRADRVYERVMREVGGE